jgi:hypothetical protein
VQKEREKVMANETELKELLGDDPPVVMERKTSGLLVQVSLHPKKKNAFLLECENGKNHAIAEVKREDVIEAFYHPLDGRFIPDPQRLFPKSKSL